MERRERDNEVIRDEFFVVRCLEFFLVIASLHAHPCDKYQANRARVSRLSVISLGMAQEKFIAVLSCRAMTTIFTIPGVSCGRPPRRLRHPTLSLIYTMSQSLSISPLPKDHALGPLTLSPKTVVGMASSAQEQPFTSPENGRSTPPLRGRASGHSPRLRRSASNLREESYRLVCGQFRFPYHFHKVDPVSSLRPSYCYGCARNAGEQYDQFRQGTRERLQTFSNILHVRLSL